MRYLNPQRYKNGDFLFYKFLKFQFKNILNKEVRNEKKDFISLYTNVWFSIWKYSICK